MTPYAPPGPVFPPASPGRRRPAWPLLVLGIVWLGVLLALVDSLSRKEVVTLFKVTAESERVELVVVAEGTDPIRLSGAGVQDDVRHRSDVTGDLRLADNVRVVLTRIGEDPVLSLVAQAPEGSGSVGTLLQDGGTEVQLQGDVAVTIGLTAPDSAPMRRASLHFAARDVRIGSGWRPGTAGATQPLLRSGRVSLIGLAQGNVPFEAQSFELGPYEMITDFPDTRTPGEQPLWWGTVTAEAGAAITTTFAVMDTRIALWRGSVPYQLGVTAFDHLRGHPRFALFCAVFVIFALIAASLLTHALQNAIDRRTTVTTTRISAMSIRSIPPLAALALALWAPSLHAQGGLRLAAIDGAKAGVGILRPRAAGECYVVVPKHVADAEYVSELAAIPDGGTRIELDKVLDRYSADLGLWRMERRMGRTACAPWPSAAEVNRALERALDRKTVGTVTPQVRGGPGEPVPVRIAALTGTSFRIYPLPGRKLAEGMSGSPVHVGGTFVGIAMEIVLPDSDSVSDSVSFGVALRLDYVEEHLGRFFYPGRPPSDPLIFASVAAPGLGQARTRRPEAALLWAGMAAGPTLYAFFTSRQEQVERTRRLQDGREEIYFETRSVHPYRELAWIPWITVGIGSFLEARAHAGRRYIPPERTDPSLRGASLHLAPQISPDAHGATRVQLVEIRF